MGSVYLAVHQTLGVTRAVKVIHDDQRRDDQACKRFAREAIALSRLRHEGVVQIIDYGRLENGWPFLCMEYIDGVDLEVRVQQRGPLRPPDALVALTQLASSIDYVHSQGIVHRDLKPANVLLQPGDPDLIKIIDFGLVHLISHEFMTKLTSERQMVGSPIFMAPEQADGSPKVTGAADVYAFAGIAYFLLSGQPVFRHTNLLELIYAHANTVPERLSARVPVLQLPERVDTLLYACLAKAPGDRPSAGELRAHLDALKSSVNDSSARVALMGIASTDSGAQITRPPVVPARGGPAGKASPGLAAAPTASGEASLHDFGEEPTQSAPTADAGLAELIAAAQMAPDPAGTRDAVINQLRAVLGDLANALAARDAEVGELQISIDRNEQDIGDAEMDLALLDSAANDAVAPDPAELGKRDDATEKVHRLNAKLADSQQAIMQLLMRKRREPDLAHLYLELDALATRLRLLVEGDA